MRFAMRMRSVASAALCAGAFTLLSAPAGASENYVLFETGQVRPIALSPNGKTLYVVNTPDGRLEIFNISGSNLSHVSSVSVGLEPVAVASRNDSEVWVVNHVSDSVSIVDVGSSPPHVVRTLLVGDEPRDIVFAGPSRNRAFITTAHRGQNVPFDPEFTTPGIGRADVWVYDAKNLKSDLNGGPLSIIGLFADTPRALAVSPDGRRVYAAGHQTGNQTSIVTEFLGIPSPPPTANYAGIPQPQVGMIVKYNGTHWVDEIGRAWDQFIQFRLPDKDVFTIDAMANPPAEMASDYFASVGTVLYNMAVNPVSGRVYVSNTDARNNTRFEGPGIFAGHTVRGNHNRNRITVLEPGGGATPHHLNKHIDFSTCCAPVPNAESELSVALPTQMAVSQDGKTLYVAALGSSKVAIYDTAQLESDTFVPNAADQIRVSGGGPTSAVLDRDGKQLYVLTRFDNSISVVDTRARQEVNHVPMFNPEPQSVTRGRRFLYDATLSSHGDSACATCHVFSDKDDLSWDLGNPDADPLVNNNPIRISLKPDPVDPSFMPMKGPMNTQSLRGMANHGPMHWRGDRTGSDIEPNIQPDQGAYNERESLRKFQAGFTGLIGQPHDLPAEDMDAYIDFQLQVMYPPNPIANLDGTLTADQEEGRRHFFGLDNGNNDSGVITCEGCHRLDPDGNREFGVKFPGFFGTEGEQAREVFPQLFKIPHLRNLYTKVGMFGFNNLAPLIEVAEGYMGFMGDQIRGFGVSRAGDIDTPFRFLHATNFSQAFIFGPNPGGFAPNAAGDPLRRKVEQFLLAFPTNHKPIVGQQITVAAGSSGVTIARLSLLVARADAGDCDLVVKGSVHNRARGFLYLGGGQFLPDSTHDNPISTANLLAVASGEHQSLTFTCAPLGTGYRIGIDRDDDGVRDGDDSQLN